MTEPIAMTIRHMKIEDYPLVYGLWTRCTGFTMRDIDDCEDAIKTFLKRNPDTCEDDDGRIIGAILAGHDGRRSRIYHTAVDPDARGRGIGSMLVGRVVETLR
uniref:GNAT family N-acetyltransferase n=1 Tax=Bifidobacterium pseudocatenulatum TaxID=28026 RepID=UPI0022E7453E